MDAPDFGPQFARPPFSFDCAPQSQNYPWTFEKQRNSFSRENLATNSTFKTELCRKFSLTGSCTYGDMCKFAHGSNDKRAKVNPLGWQKSVGDVNMTSNSNAMNEANPKRATCKYFYRGRCPYDRCIFLHQRSDMSEEKDMPRESSAISIQTAGADPKSIGVVSQINPWLKTRLCNKWKGHNSCPFGTKCTYAHGRAELRKGDLFPASESGKTWTSPTTLNENDLPDNAEKQPAPKLKVHPEVCLLKWNTSRKIVGIYADWIDEESQVPNSAMELSSCSQQEFRNTISEVEK